MAMLNNITLFFFYQIYSHLSILVTIVNFVSSQSVS